jgi:hypothetical protein
VFLKTRRSYLGQVLPFEFRQWDCLLIAVFSLARVRIEPLSQNHTCLYLFSGETRCLGTIPGEFGLSGLEMCLFGDGSFP